MHDPDEPTLDPVELERRSMAEARAEAEGRRRAGRWPLLVLLAVLISVASVAIYILVWTGGVQRAGGPDEYVLGTGFVATLTGAQIIHDGHGSSLYDSDVQAIVQRQVRGSSESGEQTVWYNKPPFEALLIAPFITLPVWVAFALWTLAAGGFSIGLAVGTLDNAVPVSRQVGWVLSLAVCSFFPVVRSLMVGADTTFVLMGLCGVYLALKWEREVWAGAALVAVAFKPQMLPAILLLLLLQRRFLTVGVFFAFMAGLYLVTVPVLGAAWPLEYLKFLTGPEGWGAGVAGAEFMQNWRGLANVLFGDAMPMLVGPAVFLLCVVSLAALVWAWRVRSAEFGMRNESLSTSSSMFGTDLLWALAGLTAVLIAIYINPEDLTLLVLPAWILGAHVARGVWGKALVGLWLVILWAGYVLAPFTLYSKNAAVAVLPMVLLMAVASALLVWILGSGERDEVGDNA